MSVVNIYCKSESQYLRFEQKKAKGGIILKKGSNKIDFDIWNLVKDGVWCRHLLKNGVIAETKSKKEELDEVIEKTEDAEQLHDMMKKAPSKKTKNKIAAKLADVVDKED